MRVNLKFKDFEIRKTDATHIVNDKHFVFVEKDLLATIDNHATASRKMGCYVV